MATRISARDEVDPHVIWYKQMADPLARHYSCCTSGGGVARLRVDQTSEVDQASPLQKRLMTSLEMTMRVSICSH